MKNSALQLVGFGLLLVAMAISWPNFAKAQDVPFLPTLGEEQDPDEANEENLPPSFFDVPDLGSSESQNALEALGGSNQNAEDLIKEEARREAFEAAIRGLLPLRPDEIREVLERFDRTQESVELPVYPPPKPQMVVETISLAPGSDPLTIKMSYGHVTTLSILDVSGEPWPIQDMTWAGNFEVIEGSEEGAHLVRLSPQSEYASGNMSMRLLGLKTPVILMLETSRDVVHYRFDAIVPEFGPFAATPLIESSAGGITTTAGSSTLSTVLQGISPGEAEQLEVLGTDGRTKAYRLNGVTYVRTPLTMLSPGWSNSVASADGTRVYEIEDAPVLLMSDKGKMVRVRLSQRIDRFEDFVDE